MTWRISWEMFNEQMAMFTAGFTTGKFNHQGKHYNYDDIELWLAPHQQPYPPLWYASNNIETVPWLARHGFNTCTVFADNAAASRRTTTSTNRSGAPSGCPTG